MSVAISEEHRLLAETANDLLRSRDARGAARELLEADEETLGGWWKEVADLGWLGLHLGEEVGGSGFGLEELVVVTEEMGRAAAPGPFVPTVIASATIDAAGNEAARALLPGLADGSTFAGISLEFSGHGRRNGDHGRRIGDIGIVRGRGSALLWGA